MRSGNGLAASIIVPTYNRCGILRRTLPGVLGQDFSGDQYEVLVVVDGSNDGTHEYLNSLTPRCEFHVIAQPNCGQAAALNAGIRAARGKIILFLDDDLLCRPSLLRIHVDAHQDGGNWIVFGPVRTSAESPRSAASEVRRHGLAHMFSGSDAEIITRHVGAAHGNSSVLLQGMLRVGGLDESYTGGRDEAEVAQRLLQSGLKYRFVREAGVEEIYVKTPRQLLHDSAVFGRNEARLSRSDPAYRRRSALGQLTRRSRAARTLTRFGAMAWPMLDPVVAAGQALAETWPVQGDRLGLAGRLLGWRLAAAVYRSAARELGSWHALNEMAALACAQERLAAVARKRF